MLSKLLLGLALLGAEWVLYVLLALSIVSITLILERWWFYREALRHAPDFRRNLRDAASNGDWDRALQLAQKRIKDPTRKAPDFESAIAITLLEHHNASNNSNETEVLTELAQDPINRMRVQWEKNLATLATIGNNAPFVGLFGTVLGIIQAFHDLSQKAGTGVQGVTAGLADALVATAIGIMVAVPAVAFFNLFQRKVRIHMTEAEALKSFIIGKLAAKGRKTRE